LGVQRAELSCLLLASLVELVDAANEELHVNYLLYREVFFVRLEVSNQGLPQSLVWEPPQAVGHTVEDDAVLLESEAPRVLCDHVFDELVDWLLVLETHLCHTPVVHGDTLATLLVLHLTRLFLASFNRCLPKQGLILQASLHLCLHLPQNEPLYVL